MMKRLMMVSVACALALGLTAGRADATALTIGDADYYVGSIVDSIPSSEVDEAGYINWLITLDTGKGPIQLPGTDPEKDETYSRIGSTLVGPFPTAVAVGAMKYDDPASNTGFNVTGFTYLLAKYDAEGGGALVWVVTGIESVDVPMTFGGKDLGHVTLFNATSVPDGGTTLILLGGALVGVGALRRRFSA